MEVKILEQEKNRLKFELVGESYTLANLITKSLWDDSDVTVSGFNLEHPQASNVVILLETKKKDAKKVLLDSINSVQKTMTEFQKKAKKAAK